MFNPDRIQSRAYILCALGMTKTEAKAVLDDPLRGANADKLFAIDVCLEKPTIENFEKASKLCGVQKSRDELKRIRQCFIGDFLDG